MNILIEENMKEMSKFEKIKRNLEYWWKRATYDDFPVNTW